ncbi:hypothetical protein [Streptomyces chiangmaiensis]|uniref:Nitroreductase n=1 Tax=Streptomyces chiangmaiensis TaxID=766497 RepID=A0ABU7FN77_9ACTN|nr:hypothetical protein [Streptomyces chiangmaiensis]MED7825575.1 hypothetical protein [Streptomyces chiangmaiensis]
MTAPTLEASTVTAFIEDATAAPSLHNAQPWRLGYGPKDHPTPRRPTVDVLDIV